MTMAEREKYIWDRLAAAGMTPAGAAGLMGNLYAESGLDSRNLENKYEKKLGLTDAAYTAAVDDGTYTDFVRDSAGYGLAQWTYWSRKEALLACVRAAGRSVGDLETQVGFLLQELAGSYKGVLAALKTARDVRTASDAVLLQFERPADQSEAVQARRAGYGQAYFDKYAGKQESREMENMSREELKELVRETVKEVLDEENPVYQDLKDVPEYWRPAASALLDAGAVNGGTPAEVCATDLRLRRETLKAAVVAVMYHDAREAGR